MYELHRATPPLSEVGAGDHRSVQKPWRSLALVLALVAAPAAAQWTLESPIPTHLNVGGIASPTSERVFLATADDLFDDGGALFESADGGATWAQREVPFSLNDGLAGIFFLDPDHGWTWGNFNYRTTDGGTTWTELPFLGSAYFLRFYTTGFGLTIGNFGRYVSTDGGLTWAVSPNEMFAFDFADDSVGLGVADSGLYRTADDGTTFSMVQSGNAAAVSFLSPTLAVAIVDDTFQRSVDGGLTWTAGDSAAGRDRLTAVSADVVLAWGRSGTFPDFDDRILRSADAGLTWTDLGEVMTAGTLDFAFPAAPGVVASDLDGNLFHSLDAGLTWTEVFTSPGPSPGFLSSTTPTFADGHTGYFAYGAGFVIKTTDGGTTWDQISSGSGNAIQDLDRFPSGDLIAVAEDGQVLTRSANAPRWRLRGTPSGSDLEAVQVLGAEEVVTVDRTGLVFTSADGGDTWTAGNPLPLGITAADLHFDSLTDGWVIGAGFAGAALFHTVDGGLTWAPAGDFQGSYVAIDLEGPNGWAAGLGGWLYRSTDGGTTWDEAEPLPGNSLTIRGLDFADLNRGYAVGATNVTSGYAARSDDGGLTWQILPLPEGTERLTDLYLLGPDELWVSTLSGVALYSATGGQSWAVLEAEPIVLASYSAIAASAEDAWIGGFRGTIQHFEGPPGPPVNQPPVASFEFVTAGLSVAFTDTSTDADGSVVAWLWDFGDGTTSTEQHPVHVFASADTYIVRLTVTDDDGDTGATVQFIVVQPGPGGTFGDFTEVTPLDPLFVTPQDEDFWVASSAPADVDGDGDLDLVVLGFYVVYNTSVEERLVLIRNDGPAGPEEWEFGYLDLPLGTLSSGASDLAWGDSDGDGDQDLVIGSDGQTVLYRNDAGTLVPTDTVLPPYWEDNDQAEFDLRSISWADVDNDGDQDLLLPSVWDADTFSYRTALMRNDGPDGSGGIVFTEVDAGFAPTVHAQSLWADDDGDQDLDLLLVHLAPLTDDGFIRRYRNDGDGVFVGEDILGALSIEHGQAQWGDVDEDGDLDILVAGLIRDTDGSFGTVLRLYRNDAGTYAPVEVIECPICEGWIDLTAATWADYDSDGDVDILLAGNYNSGSQIEGRAKIYDNQDGVFTDSGNQLPAPRASGSRGGSFTWLDLDGEGDLDYFIAGQYFVPGGNGLVEAQMHVYRNDATAENAAPSAPSGLTSQIVGDGRTLVLAWQAATDDSTPAGSLTYDLRLYRDGVPVTSPRRLPQPGDVHGLDQWTLTGLPDGSYTWTLQAVDSAYNGGPVTSSTFEVGESVSAIFADSFEAGDLSDWSSATP